MPGYEGPFCEVEINECSSSPCKNGATCVNLIDHFSCHCAEGFKGKFSLLKCLVLQMCLSNSISAMFIRPFYKNYVYTCVYVKVYMIWQSINWISMEILTLYLLTVLLLTLLLLTVQFWTWILMLLAIKNDQVPKHNFNHVRLVSLLGSFRYCGFSHKQDFRNSWWNECFGTGNRKV